MIESLTLDHWTWAGIAVVLAVFELIAPGVFFLWFSLAAGLTALIAFVAPGLGWPVHLALFAILAVVITWAGKRYVRQNETPSEDETLNLRGQQLIGKEFNLIAPIENGTGRIKIGDSPWRVEGPDLPNGTRIRVVAVSGASLEVEEAA